MYCIDNHGAWMGVQENLTSYANKYFHKKGCCETQSVMFDLGIHKHINVLAPNFWIH